MGRAGLGGVPWHLATFSSRHPLPQNIFTSTVLHASAEATEVTIGTLSIFGVRKPPSKVLLNGQEKPFSYLDNEVWPHLGVPVLGVSIPHLLALVTGLVAEEVGEDSGVALLPCRRSGGAELSQAA